MVLELKVNQGDFMIYVTGGICGNYYAYKELIRTINLKKRDDLYVIGDIIGPFGESFALLEDMSMRENVFPVLGCNEFKALKIMKKISDDDGKLRKGISIPDSEAKWLIRFLESFSLTDADTRAFLIEYFSEMPLFEELSLGGVDYLLINNESGDFPIDIRTDNKTVITVRTLAGAFSENCDTNEITAICLDTGEEYYI